MKYRLSIILLLGINLSLCLNSEGESTVWETPVMVKRESIKTYSKSKEDVNNEISKVNNTDSISIDYSNGTEGKYFYTNADTIESDENVYYTPKLNILNPIENTNSTEIINYEPVKYIDSLDNTNTYSRKSKNKDDEEYKRLIQKGKEVAANIADSYAMTYLPLRKEKIESHENKKKGTPALIDIQFSPIDNSNFLELEDFINDEEVENMLEDMS